MASRRSPNSKALELLDRIEQREQATKWDLVKVLGNETQFRIWITEFFIKKKSSLNAEMVNAITIPRQSEANFHKLLKSRNLIKLFTSLSGRRLRR